MALIVDAGTFDYAADPERFPVFNQPGPSENGLVCPQLQEGLPPFAIKARVQLLRDLGPAVSPFDAFLIAQGIETLPLRMERHMANAARVADHLEGQAAVASVAWAGLASSPYHDRAQEYLPRGAGSVLGSTLAGEAEAGRAFVDALVIHPASTTHSQLTSAEQRAAGVAPGFVRLSVELEHIDDVLADLDRGFAAIA